jgi:energy-coupling factor transporter ATP-binding protein EcfA2
MDVVDSPILELRELAFKFADQERSPGARVLDELSLAVPRGSPSVLFGRADAGKSTLGRIITGLIPRFTGGAMGGSVLLDSQEIRGAPPYDLMTSVGLVAQDSEEQILTTRCDSEVAFALESMGVPRAEMRQRVMESLEKVGLPGFAARNPATLSGGEKKRLLVACLHAIGPALWILDEALGELDFEWKTRILDLILEAGGTALIMESRWSRLAASRASTFFLLEGGRIRASGMDSQEKSFSGALADAGIRQGPPRGTRRADAKSILRVEGLRFQFDAPAAFTLHIDSLDLKVGERCALVGRNGSGKSTLGRILCGLLRPQSGSLRIGSESGWKSLGLGDLNARVGYLFQNPDHQIYLPSVREELSLGLRRQRLDHREIEKRVEEAAQVFGLPDLGAPPALLSYGARRRLQAATFFLLSRDLLILDELDSGLSYREVESLIDALASHGPGIVLITHDMDLATASCDRILSMDDGRITADAESAFGGAGQVTS